MKLSEWKMALAIVEAASEGTVVSWIVSQSGFDGKGCLLVQLSRLGINSNKLACEIDLFQEQPGPSLFGTDYTVTDFSIMTKPMLLERINRKIAECEEHEVPQTTEEELCDPISI
jgi:hypothetical protein